MDSVSWGISYADDSVAASVFGDNKELQTIAEDSAAALLWNWTGRAYGKIKAVVRPTRTSPYPERAVGSPWNTYLIAGRQLVFSCGLCGRGCRCRGYTPTVILPKPTTKVLRVTIGGEDLPSTSYQLLNNEALVRTDGKGWPVYQDIRKRADEDGSWEVEFEYGVDTPPMGKLAAGLLAMEIGKGLMDDVTCQLPERVQTVTRQGVTVAMLDGFEDLDEGRTGIWLVDSWIASVTKPPRASRVYSVDIPRTIGGRSV